MVLFEARERGIPQFLPVLGCCRTMLDQYLRILWAQISGVVSRKPKRPKIVLAQQTLEKPRQAMRAVHDMCLSRLFWRWRRSSKAS